MTKEAKYTMRYVNSNKNNYPINITINNETISITDSSFLPDGAKSIENGFEYEFIAGSRKTSRVEVEYNSIENVSNDITISVSPLNPIANQSKVIVIKGSVIDSEYVNNAGAYQYTNSGIAVSFGTKTIDYTSSDVLVSCMCSLDNVNNITIKPAYGEIDDRTIVDIYSGDTLLASLDKNNVSTAISAGVNTIKVSFRDKIPDSSAEYYGGCLVVGSN